MSLGTQSHRSPAWRPLVRSSRSSWHALLPLPGPGAFVRVLEVLRKTNSAIQMSSFSVLSLVPVPAAIHKLARRSTIPIRAGHNLAVSPVNQRGSTVNQILRNGPVSAPNRTQTLTCEVACPDCRTKIPHLIPLFWERSAWISPHLTSKQSQLRETVSQGE